MADFVKFSELSSLSAVEASALIPIVQDGDNFTTSLSSLQNSLTLNSSDIGDATSIATPDTIALRDSSGSVSFTSLTASDVVNIGNQITFQSGAAAAATRTNLGAGTAGDAIFQAASYTGTGSVRRLMGLDTTDNATFNLVISSNGIQVSAGGTFYDGIRGIIKFEGNGVLCLRNAQANNFSRLQFGGTTSSFPSLKRDGTTISIRLADDSGDAPLTCSNLTASGTVSAANLSLTNPLSLANGGTGGTDASTARTNLGLGTGDSPTFAGLTLGGNITATANNTYDIGGLNGTKFRDICADRILQVAGAGSIRFEGRARFSCNSSNKITAIDSNSVLVDFGAANLTASGTVSAARMSQTTSTAADPTTTEYPTSGQWGIHKNTSSGDVFLAYNDGGTIKKVQLT